MFTSRGASFLHVKELQLTRVSSSWVETVSLCQSALAPPHPSRAQNGDFTDAVAWAGVSNDGIPMSSGGL